MPKTNTSNSGSGKVKKAINQIVNAERLISSLPKQYDREKIREISLYLSQTAKRIERELTEKGTTHV
jgi:hypothetical protein